MSALHHWSVEFGYQLPIDGDRKPNIGNRFGREACLATKVFLINDPSVVNYVVADQAKRIQRLICENDINLLGIDEERSSYALLIPSSRSSRYLLFNIVPMLFDKS
jgi:hypothetical protein